MYLVKVDNNGREDVRVEHNAETVLSLLGDDLKATGILAEAWALDFRGPNPVVTPITAAALEAELPADVVTLVKARDAVFRRKMEEKKAAREVTPEPEPTPVEETPGGNSRP